MSTDRTIEKLKKRALIDGHFVFTSGRHSSVYINKDAVYARTFEISKLCRIIAAQFVGFDPQVVIAPAVGGVVLSQWTTHHLSTLSKRDFSVLDPVLAAYADKSEDGKGFVIKREYIKLIPGKMVLVVEDVLTTGASAKSVVKAVRKIGGEVIGVGALFNRGNVTKRKLGGVPKLFSVCNEKMDDWPEDECPLCAGGVPINMDFGHGTQFGSNRA